MQNVYSEIMLSYDVCINLQTLNDEVLIISVSKFLFPPGFWFHCSKALCTQKAKNKHPDPSAECSFKVQVSGFFISVDEACHIVVSSFWSSFVFTFVYFLVSITNSSLLLNANDSIFHIYHLRWLSFVLDLACIIFMLTLCYFLFAST